MRLARNRASLGLARESRDMVDRSGAQVHSVNLKSCQIWLCTQGVCQNAKGIQAVLGVAKFSRSVSLWMHERVVKLVCQKEKLASVSFAKLQFWTGSKWHHYMDQKCSKECMLLDLGVLQG